MQIDGEPRWAVPAAGGVTSLCRLWRTVGPGALAPDMAEALLAAATTDLASSGSECVAPPSDDGPAVIHEARAALERWGPTYPGSDVVATLALALALRGDGTAARFLADALERLAAGAGGPHHARFARAWRARSGNPADATATGG